MSAPQTGTALRLERKRRKLSQQAAGAQIGVSRHTWWRWEMEFHTPTGAAARALRHWWADGVGVHVTDVPASATTGETATVPPFPEASKPLAEKVLADMEAAMPPALREELGIDDGDDALDVIGGV